MLDPQTSAHPSTAAPREHARQCRLQIWDRELRIPCPRFLQTFCLSGPTADGKICVIDITTFLSQSTPGVFSQSQNGIGAASASHADFSLVTNANPARPGETILVYLTGLGSVSPAIADGVPAPTAEPLARASDANISVRMQGRPAAITYAGLAPGFVGLYQINVTIPAGTTAGSQFLNVLGSGAQSSQIQIPVRAAGSVDFASRLFTFASVLAAKSKAA